MSRPILAGCPYCGTARCLCPPHPTPAELARIVAIGQRTLWLRRHPVIARTVEAIRVGAPSPRCIVREWRRLKRLENYAD